MKKLFIILLVMLLLIGGCLGFLYWSWNSVTEDAVPLPEIAANGQAVPPASGDWHIPLIGGLLEKDFLPGTGKAEVYLGTMDAPLLPLEIPTGYQAQLVLNEKTLGLLFEGDAASYTDFSYPEEDGSYILDIFLNRTQTKGAAYGSFSYRITFDIVLPMKDPVISVSTEQIEQGGLLEVVVENVPEGVTPSLTTELGATCFMASGEQDRMIAYVGVSYAWESGSYPLAVSCGEFSEEYTVTVTEGEFERQDLTIDISDPVISEANSPAAYAQYRAAIYPLYETKSEIRYWQGSFLLPVEGRISTPYGIKRYTNGATTPSRHAGTDIAVAEGTPVQCPADGVVVFSEYLLNTGNTIAIEHGGGLKTFYFHLSERSITVGDQVEKGQQLGLVGTTGYSTGPHLHFEIRLANQSVNPWLFIDGKIPE